MHIPGGGGGMFLCELRGLRGEVAHSLVGYLLPVCRRLSTCVELHWFSFHRIVPDCATLLRATYPQGISRTARQSITASATFVRLRSQNPCFFVFFSVIVLIARTRHRSIHSGPGYIDQKHATCGVVSPITQREHAAVRLGAQQHVRSSTMPHTSKVSLCLLPMRALPRQPG